MKKVLLSYKYDEPIDPNYSIKKEKKVLCDGVLRSIGGEDLDTQE